MLDKKFGFFVADYLKCVLFQDFFMPNMVEHILDFE